MIALKEQIDPYDLNIKSLSVKDKEKWEKKIKMILENWSDRTIVFICGEIYHLNFDGIKLLPKVGIGKQLQWLNRKIKELRCIRFPRR